MAGFLHAFDREAWLSDPRFATGQGRVDHARLADP